ncbi:MAG TPA: DUF3499 family protein [Acidimicrobiales bacterium]|nr:DUF3499 family protein [Acidimicrobiales bacterium]
MDRSSVCARPGCQAPAVAWLTYAYQTRQVWLDDVGAGTGDRWPMCAGHAGGLKVPQGWTQVDRRTGERPSVPSSRALAS